MNADAICCCPRLDARDCYRYRYDLDLAEAAGEEITDDGWCECGCHDGLPDYEDDGPTETDLEVPWAGEVAT